MQRIAVARENSRATVFLSRSSTISRAEKIALHLVSAIYVNEKERLCVYIPVARARLIKINYCERKIIVLNRKIIENSNSILIFLSPYYYSGFPAIIRSSDWFTIEYTFNRSYIQVNECEGRIDHWRGSGSIYRLSIQFWTLIAPRWEHGKSIIHILYIYQNNRVTGIKHISRDSRNTLPVTHNRRNHRLPNTISCYSNTYLITWKNVSNAVTGFLPGKTISYCRNTSRIDLVTLADAGTASHTLSQCICAIFSDVITCVGVRVARLRGNATPAIVGRARVLPARVAMRAWLGQGGRRKPPRRSDPRTRDPADAHQPDPSASIHRAALARGPYLARNPHLSLRLGGESGFGGSVTGHLVALQQPERGTKTRARAFTREWMRVKRSISRDRSDRSRSLFGRHRRSRIGGRDTTGGNYRRDGDTTRLRSTHDAPIGRPRGPRQYRALVRRRVPPAARDLRSPEIPLRRPRSGGDVRRRYKFLEVQPDGAGCPRIRIAAPHAGGLDHGGTNNRASQSERIFPLHLALMGFLFWKLFSKLPFFCMGRWERIRYKDMEVICELSGELSGSCASRRESVLGCSCVYYVITLVIYFVRKFSVHVCIRDAIRGLRMYIYVCAVSNEIFSPYISSSGERISFRSIFPLDG